MTAFQIQLKKYPSQCQIWAKAWITSVELLSPAIASQPLPQFLQAPFHPNVIFQNLNLYSLTVSQQQGYYAQMLGETSSNQSQNREI